MNNKELNEKLLMVSFFGNISKVKQYLADGADVNAVDDHGDTPLINACMRGNWDVVEVLLNSGADSSITGIRRFLPIEVMFWSGEEIPRHIFDRLNKNGDFDANRKGETGMRAIHLAAKRKCAANVLLLLSLGADPNAVKDDGWTPLLLALANGQLDNARVLLDAGARLMLPDDALKAKQASGSSSEDF